MPMPHRLERIAPDLSSNAKLQKNAMPVTRAGIMRGHSMPCCNDPRNRNRERCAITDSTAMTSVVRAPPTPAIRRLLTMELVYSALSKTAEKLSSVRTLHGEMNGDRIEVNAASTTPASGTTTDTVRNSASPPLTSQRTHP